MEREKKTGDGQRLGENLGDVWTKEKNKPEKLIKEMTTAELVHLHNMLVEQVWRVEHELSRRGEE